MPAIITKNKTDKVNHKGIEPLPQTKKKNGYAYTLVERNEKAAIYSMVNEQYPEDTSVAYEVCKIVHTNAAVIQQKSGKKKGMWYHYPPAEKFPGNEDFGKTAWTYLSLENAQKKYKEIG